MPFRLLPLLAALPLIASAAPDHPLQGPAFSDPTRTVEMSDDWRAKPIADPARPGSPELIVTLDQHLYPALKPIIDAYAEERGLRIAVDEGTCGISAGALADKKAHIGGFCCPPGDGDRLPGLRFHTLGIAALALLVHPENPLETVTLDEARELFGGHTARWSALSRGEPGVPTEPVEAIGRLHCKARPGHWRTLLADDDLFSPRLREVSTIPDMIAAVARRHPAIGYETLWMARKNHALGAVKTLRVNGASPHDETALIDGRYPLYRVYNITRWSEGPARDERADTLVEHLEARFHQVEAKYGFIPAERLRQAGWRFVGDELVGGPGE